VLCLPTLCFCVFQLTMDRPTRNSRKKTVGKSSLLQTALGMDEAPADYGVGETTCCTSVSDGAVTDVAATEAAV
jgi:hypothetical protein